MELNDLEVRVCKNCGEQISPLPTDYGNVWMHYKEDIGWQEFCSMDKAWPDAED